MIDDGPDPRRDPDRDRGTIGVLLMVLVVMCLGAAGLVVDGGRAMGARRHAANAAEGAARYAVASQSLSAVVDADVLRERALDFAVRSGVPAASVQVEVDLTDPAHPVVDVTITEHVPAVFLALAGADDLTVRATGSARFVYST